MHSTIVVIASVLLFSALLCVRCNAHSEQFHRMPGVWRPDSKLVLGSGDEPRLANTRCLLCNGTNAEAYWSPDGKWLSLQRIGGQVGSVHTCDLIYTMRAEDGGDLTLRAPVWGRDTCSYMRSDSFMYFSATLDQAVEFCPPAPDMSDGYVWPIYEDMDVWLMDLSLPYGSPLERITGPAQGYNAETTLSPDGTHAVFTSSRSGDLELYSFPVDNPQQVRRLTYSPGYDGGAYYSNNNSMLCWRAARPQGDNLTNYLSLLQLGLVAPIGMQLYTANADGTDARQVAQLPGTNFAPSFLPDDSGLIFASNMHDPSGGNFQLYTISLDGTNVTQVTTRGSFNAFPMFSPDGRSLVWASDRDATEYGEIYIYRAEWYN